MYTNQQTERHRLHLLLIDVENRTCSNPDCRTPFYKREIHRIIPALGYIETNVLVRDYNCHHFIDHPASKFRIGDRVSVNGRTPTYVDLPRHRPRHIIAIRYEADKRCNYYLLGANCKGTNTGNGNPLNGYTAYEFRSYMLQPLRRWHHHRKYIRSLCDKQQSLPKNKVNTTALEEAKILATIFKQI